MNILYLIYLIILIVVYTVASIINARKSKKSSDTRMTEKKRVAMYRAGITLGWVSLAVVLVMSFFGNISLADLGLRPLEFNYNYWFTLVILVLGAGFVCFLLYQVIGYLTSAKFRSQLKADLAKDETMNNVMVPRTRREKIYFTALSLTAGITEEVVFRGFLYFLAMSVFESLSMIIVVVVASGLFGVFHLYQGFAGVVKTAVLGVLLGCLYLVTGSLLLPILLHFVVDASAIFVLEDEKSEFADPFH